jgi:hypothetical protein
MCLFVCLLLSLAGLALSHSAISMQIKRLVSGYNSNSLFYKTNVEARKKIPLSSPEIRTVTNQYS